MTIPLRDVIRSAPPSIDQRGLLFQIDGHVYRAFRGDSARMFRRLLEAPWLPELFAAGVVDFHEADVALEGYELVVEARRVPVVSYPPEWPTAMLREAGATIARVGAFLAQRGFGLQDAHPWNVLFEGSTPVFVDLGSIIEDDDVPSAWYWEFRRHIVAPIALHRVGLHALGDAVMARQRGGWTALFDRRFLRWFPPGYLRVVRSSGDPTRFFVMLGEYLEGREARGSRTKWSKYYLSGDAQVGESAAYTTKQASVDALLAEIPSGTVLDLGSNEGWYSRLAVAHGNTVTALDMDDRVLSMLFRSARREGLPIQTLRMDFMWPTGSSGFGLEYRAAPDRIRSDTVLALAVVHHLVGRQGVTFESFARVLDLFASRHVILEWIPPEDALIAEWSLASRADYRLESLTTAFAPYFALKAVRSSSPQPRQVLLFERVSDTDAME